MTGRQKMKRIFSRFKEYISQNLSSISKVFINHIGMTIFGLVVLITAKLISSTVKNDIVFYLAGALTVLMYFSLLYTAMWERGAADKIKIDGGRMKENIWHGLWFYLLGDIIGVVFGFLTLIFSFFITAEESLVNNIYAVFKFITHYWNSMYLNVTGISGIHSVIYIAVIIPGAIVCFVSYILGVKGYRCLFREPKYDRNKKIR